MEQYGVDNIYPTLLDEYDWLIKDFELEDADNDVKMDLINSWLSLDEDGV